MSLRVVKIPGRLKARATFIACANRCRAVGQGDCGFREATHHAFVAGRAVPLCDACSREWPRMWDAALAGPRRRAEAREREAVLA